MPLYDVRCLVGHDAEIWAKFDEREVPCTVCGEPTARVWKSRGAGVIGDEIPGGQVIENLGHQPMVFYSKQAIVKEADRRGLQPMVRYVNGDKHLTNWDSAIDPYTMAAAIALVARRAERSRPELPDDATCETAAFSVTEHKPQ